MLYEYQEWREWGTSANSAASLFYACMHEQDYVTGYEEDSVALQITFDAEADAESFAAQLHIGNPPAVE